VLNKTFGLSHAKIASVFGALFGVKLTRGACAQITPRSVRRLEAADQEVRREVKAAARLTPDETGRRVGGKPARLHAQVAQRAVCYAIDCGCSADALERAVGIGYSGKMTHDGYSTYGRFTKAIHQQCPGHIPQARAGAGSQGEARGAAFTRVS
jgi:transposase